jgi:hypothetical protein
MTNGRELGLQSQSPTAVAARGEPDVGRHNESLKSLDRVLKILNPRDGFEAVWDRSFRDAENDLKPAPKAALLTWNEVLTQPYEIHWDEPPSATDPT